MRPQPTTCLPYLTQITVMVFALALCVAGCGGRDAEPALELAQGKLELQTSSGVYELRGSVSLTRQGDTPFAVSASLGEHEQSVLVNLPVGRYQTALDAGYRLLRVSDSPPTDRIRVRSRLAEPICLLTQAHGVQSTGSEATARGTRATFACVHVKCGTETAWSLLG